MTGEEKIKTFISISVGQLFTLFIDSECEYFHTGSSVCNTTQSQRRTGSRSINSEDVPEDEQSLITSTDRDEVTVSLNITYISIHGLHIKSRLTSEVINYISSHNLRLHIMS